MADRFYHPGPLEPGPVTLSGPEAHHLAHVLRLKPGDSIRLFNGDGSEYPARLEAVAKARVDVFVESRQVTSRESTRQVTVACPLPKGDRGQFLIEKLTELGVSRYIPLRTQLSVVHPGEGKAEKLRRYVIEASKQCGRNVLMHVDETQEWSEFVGRVQLRATRWLADPSGSTPASLGEEACIIALGPEGGWTGEEVRLGTDHGWQLVSLGKSILRIETAAIAAAALSLLGG